MATGSLFWFFQAQNARSYALCLLIGVGILACSLALLGREQTPRRARQQLGAMIALMFAAAFTHFYMLYESLAVLVMLFVLSRQQRYATAAAAGALVVASALYMKLVVEPHTLVSLSHNWYQNDPTWYFLVLKSCLHYTFGDEGLLRDRALRRRSAGRPPGKPQRPHPVHDRPSDRRCWSACRCWCCLPPC